MLTDVDSDPGNRRLLYAGAPPPAAPPPLPALPPAKAPKKKTPVRQIEGLIMAGELQVGRTRHKSLHLEISRFEIEGRPRGGPGRPPGPPRTSETSTNILKPYQNDIKTYFNPIKALLKAPIGPQ